MGNYLVGLILIACVTIVVNRMYKRKKNRKAVQCGGDCNHCGGGCH